jgi:hypothetical protein
MSENAGQPKVRAQVARGRTVVAEHPTDVEMFAHPEDGRPITRPVSVTYNPGDEVELPAEEAKRLTRLGFLVDPDGPAPIVDFGPTLSNASGAPNPSGIGKVGSATW